MLRPRLTPEQIALRDAAEQEELKARGGKPLPIYDRALEKLLEEVESEPGYWEEQEALAAEFYFRKKPQAQQDIAASGDAPAPPPGENADSSQKG